MPNSPTMRAVFAAVTLLLFAQLLHSQQLWRSQLYPTTLQIPASTPFTQRMLQDWSYAGAFEVQPIPLRTEPVFDAVTYGADPTGARDATDAIQRAIDAVGATNGVVSLPAGAYSIQTERDTRLRLRYSNVVLRGAGVDRDLPGKYNHRYAQQNRHKYRFRYRRRLGGCCRHASQAQ